MKIKLMSLFVLGIGLSACGGSDSGNTTTNRPSLPPTTIAPTTGNLTPLIDEANIQIFGDSQTQAGSAIGFALIPKGAQQIDVISW